MVLLDNTQPSAQLVLTKHSARSGDRYYRLEPDLSIVLIILAPLPHMNTRAIFVKGIKAMKPEDESTVCEHLGTHRYLTL